MLSVLLGIRKVSVKKAYLELVLKNKSLIPRRIGRWRGGPRGRMNKGSKVLELFEEMLHQYTVQIVSTETIM